MTQWLASVGTSVALTLMLSSPAAAQTSFSGRWTLMRDRSTVQWPNGQGFVTISVLGSDFTIQQTPDRLIVELANQLPKWVVMLDGSETRSVSLRDDIGAKFDRTYRGEWRGETFVIHVTGTDTWKDGRTVTGEQTYELSLNPDGTLRVAGIPMMSKDGPLGASVYRWLEAVE